jgi:hypothetical protein
MAFNRTSGSRSPYTNDAAWSTPPSPLVYVDLDPDVLLKAMQKYDLVFNTRTSKISYYSNVKNVQTGVWLVIDPPMADVKDAPWSVSHEPYVLECYVDAYLKK